MIYPVDCGQRKEGVLFAADLVRLAGGEHVRLDLASVSGFQGHACASLIVVLELSRV